MHLKMRTYAPRILCKKMACFQNPFFRVTPAVKVKVKAKANVKTDNAPKTINQRSPPSYQLTWGGSKRRITP